MLIILALLVAFCMGNDALLSRTQRTSTHEDAQLHIGDPWNVEWTGLDGAFSHREGSRIRDHLNRVDSLSSEPTSGETPSGSRDHSDSFQSPMKGSPGDSNNGKDTSATVHSTNGFDPVPNKQNTQDPDISIENATADLHKRSDPKLMLNLSLVVIRDMIKANLHARMVDELRRIGK